MSCPACGGSERTEINIRMKQESDLKQVLGSTWDARNMARCDECGNLYDPRFAAGEGGNSESTANVNCSGCGSLNPESEERCTQCGATLG